MAQAVTPIIPAPEKNLGMPEQPQLRSPLVCNESSTKLSKMPYAMNVAQPTKDLRPIPHPDLNLRPRHDPSLRLTLTDAGMKLIQTTVATPTPDLTPKELLVKNQPIQPHRSFLVKIEIRLQLSNVRPILATTSILVLTKIWSNIQIISMLETEDSWTRPSFPNLLPPLILINQPTKEPALHEPGNPGC